MGQIADGCLPPPRELDLKRNTADRVLELNRPAPIYRLCDYNPDELSFLSDALSHRGAKRLLLDERLIRLDLGVTG